jgi:hypothetical protein
MGHGYSPNPHYSRRLLLQPPIRRYDKPDGGRARHSVDQHTVSSMPPSLAAPRARLAWRLGGYVTNSREESGLRRISFDETRCQDEPVANAR